MSPPPRLVRRLVVNPVLLLAACLLAALLVLVIGVAGSIAPLTPRRRVLGLARFALAYLRLDVWLVLAGAGLWLRHPLHRGAVARRRWTEAHCRLLREALRQLLAVAERTVGFRLEVDPGRPPGIDPDRPLIVLARHAGPGDSFALVWLVLDRLGRTPRVVLKDVLLWDPGLDVVLTRPASAGTMPCCSSRRAATGRPAATAAPCGGCSGPDAAAPPDGPRPGPASCRRGRPEPPPCSARDRTPTSSSWRTPAWTGSPIPAACGGRFR
jgi:hypothetical protein